MSMSLTVKRILGETARWRRVPAVPNDWGWFEEKAKDAPPDFLDIRFFFAIISDDE